MCSHFFRIAIVCVAVSIGSAAPAQEKLLVPETNQPRGGNSDSPLVLEFRSGHLRQEIAVQPENDFFVVTCIGKGTWTMKGKVGKVAEVTIPMEMSVSYRHEGDSSFSYSRHFQFELRIDVHENQSSGGAFSGVIGFEPISSIWLRRGLDPVPPLLKALDRRDLRFHVAAGYLGNLGPAGKAAVPLLIEALEDKDPEIRETAVQALGKMGAAAEAALPKLKALAADEQEATRRLAQQAVEAIEKPPAKD